MECYRQIMSYRMGKLFLTVLWKECKMIVCWKQVEGKLMQMDDLLTVQIRQ